LESIEAKSKMDTNEKNSYPSIAQSFGILGLYIIITIGVALLITGIFEIINYNNLPLNNLVGYTLAGILIIIFAWMKKSRIEATKQIFLFGSMPVALSVVLLVLTISLVIVIEPITTLIPIPEFMMELFAMLSEKSIYTMILVVFIGPVIEELLIRGIVLDGFLKRYPPWKAILWSSIIFGLFHLNPWQFIPAFFLGILMGYVYWKTKSLIPCIFIHFINNGISYTATILVNKDIATVADLFEKRGDYITIYIITACLLVLSTLWLVKIVGRPASTSDT